MDYYNINKIKDLSNRESNSDHKLHTVYYLIDKINDRLNNFQKL